MPDTDTQVSNVLQPHTGHAGGNRAQGCRGAAFLQLAGRAYAFAAEQAVNAARGCPSPARNVMNRSGYSYLVFMLPYFYCDLTPAENGQRCCSHL